MESPFSQASALAWTARSTKPLTILAAVFASRLSTMIVGSASSFFFSFRYGSRGSVPDLCVSRLRNLDFSCLFHFRFLKSLMLRQLNIRRTRHQVTGVERGFEYYFYVSE